MNEIFSLDIYYLASFFAALFAASFAIPTGALVIIVSFASVAEGWRDVSILAMLSLSATVSGDYSAYSLSRHFRNRLNATIWKFGWMRNRIISVEKIFDRYSSHTVFLTRFLFSGIGPYVNFFSGLRAMPQGTFLKAVIGGELIYCLLSISVGYFFRDTWTAAIALAQDYTAFTVFALLGVYIVFRIVRLVSKK